MTLPFRVLHVLDDFSRSASGVTSTVRQIAEWQAQHCEWVGVHATGTMDMPVSTAVHLYRSEAQKIAPRWRYPVGGARRLARLMQEQRVTHVHIHEFWRGAYVSAMLAAGRLGLPVILSAHGSTAPWALRGQSALKTLKKSLYWTLFGRFLMTPRTVLHAVTPLEREHMLAFFGNEPRVIPNAIRLDAVTSPVPPAALLSRRFVFLGRLHPVKGVELLIDAFDQAALPAEWELVIAGPEEVSTYVDKLKAAASNSRKANRISFVGPLHGEEKAALLRSAWTVVVPSKTEVIGMVNLEAAAAGTPTITTRATGLLEWGEIGGVLVHDDLPSLVAALESCANWPPEERSERGERSRQHVERHYSLQTVGQKWLFLLQDTTAGKVSTDSSQRPI